MPRSVGYTPSDVGLAEEPGKLRAAAGTPSPAYAALKTRMGKEIVHGGPERRPSRRPSGMTDPRAPN